MEKGERDGERSRGEGKVKELEKKGNQGGRRNGEDKQGRIEEEMKRRKD